MYTVKAFKDTLLAYDVRLDSLLGDTNPKIKKSKEKTFICHLKPERAVCPKMGLCEAICLDKSGNPAYKNTKENARNARTELYKNNRELFLQALTLAVAQKAHKHPQCAFRLNGTSDIVFEHKSHRVKVDNKLKLLLARYEIGVEIGLHSIFDIFPDNQFYDYSKIASRFNRKLPSNYYLTYSLDGKRNAETAAILLAHGHNVAVPFFELPEKFTIGQVPAEVINGDLSDYRPADKQGVIVGLKYKRITNGERFKNNGFIIASDSI